jgi:serine/threonine protein kinase/DNA-binding winged helix-turn-helix (wHTH) protein/tetratricopeptide (TPR) repeat protein
MNAGAGIEHRYMDRPYALSGRLIDPIRGSVSYNNESHPLKRKHLEVLACLASAGDTMVARTALIDLVWNGNVLVGDTGLTNAIYYLRRALQDNDADKPLIRTIPRRGYLLTVEARLIDRKETAAFSAGAPVIGKPGWHLSRPLGSSAISETWLAQAQDAEIQDAQAQRVFRFCRSEQHLRLLQRETTVMRYLRETLAGRRDIAIILDWQLDEPPYFLEMDYARHGSLPQWAAAQGGLRRIASAERMRLIAEVAGALAAVHAADIVHRNVSAASVLIDEDHIGDPEENHDHARVHARLGEFGWSDLTDRTRLDSLQITSAGLTLIGDEGMGEHIHLAPECLAGQPATGASDVYALGVLLLQMAVGDLQRSLDAGWERDVEAEPLRALIAACTDAQPERRPTAAVVSERLKAFNAASDRDTPRNEGADVSPPAVEPRRTTSMIGQTIGPYRILDQLGEGGMGLVYLAEQSEPVQRKVALKLIKAGMDSKQVLARFEAERQALALMNHANVATVYDAGSTASREPYFAMEYVRGLDIDAHCDQLALDVRERITLFLQVCEGILHAHQKGLIHRDIKPGNILVSRAQGLQATVKVIDFGVAKSLSGVLTGHAAHTRLGSFVGTPAYSSPEQVSGPLVNVDTRADIYSLGVVLYQLLAGVTPYSEEELNRKTPVELARLLSAERPPSLLARFSGLSVEEEDRIARQRSLSVEQMKVVLGSDLSWIVGKCLQSDPDDRYPSVLELEKDLRRWLDDEPIEARPASRMYRMRKFVRRHRIGVALGSVATLALLTTTGAAVVGFVRAEEALKAAREATVEAEMAADFQANQMQSIDPTAMGLSLRNALIEAVEHQGPPDGGDPAAAAQRRQQQESLLRHVNMTDLALSQLGTNTFQPALATIQKDFGDSPLLQARLWQTMANTLAKFGQYEAAVEPQRLALEKRRRLLGENHALTLLSLSNQGDLRCEMSRYDEAEADLRTATTGLRRVLGDDHTHTLRSITMTANCLQHQGKNQMALPLYREAYARNRRTLGHDHLRSLTSANDLASALMLSGKYKEALPYAEAAVNGFRRLSSKVPHRDEHLPAVTSTLASVYEGLSRHAESQALAREALEAGRRVWGEKHPKTLAFANNLATSLSNQGRHAEAEAYLRQILEVRREVLGDEHEHVFVSQYDLANTLVAQEKYSEGELLFRDIIAKQKRLFGDDHVNMVYPTVALAYCLNDQGEFDEAEALFRRALATFSRVHGNDGRYTLVAKRGLGNALRGKGEVGEARAVLEDVVKIQRRTLGDQDIDTLWSIEGLAAVALAEGNLGQAETLMREALTGYRKVLGDDNADTLDTIEQLIDLLRKRGALDEATALELELKASRQRNSGAKS